MITYLPIGSRQRHPRKDISGLWPPICGQAYVLINPDHSIPSKIKPSALHMRIQVRLNPWWATLTLGREKARMPVAQLLTARRLWVLSCMRKAVISADAPSRYIEMSNWAFILVSSSPNHHLLQQQRSQELLRKRPAISSSAAWCA